MRIFFGKIKPTTDNKQIKGAYYETLSPVKLGDLQPNDYVFIISGKHIHLWQAKERIDIDGNSRMDFDVKQESLPLSTKKIVAFKYFRLDSSLMVLTVRQSPKAFYQIHLADKSFTEEMLISRDTYENENNYRRIIVRPNKEGIDKNSNDIQLYFQNDKLQIEEASFFDNELFPSFVDNLDKLGKGRKQKDKALVKIKEGKSKETVYTYQQLPILRMYDALFNPYGNKEVLPKGEDSEDDDEKDIQETDGSLELSSYNQIFYGPPGTGKTYKVIKSFCLEEEAGKADVNNKIKLDANVNFWHIAPGRNAYLWGELKKGNALGYEWADKSWEDLNHLTLSDIEEEGWGNFQLITYLRLVKKGDYFCVISGKKLLGIAEATSSYDYATALNNPFKFQTVPIKWLKIFDQPLYLNSSQTKTFVRLNHGRRWSSLLTLLRENGFYFNNEEVQDNIVIKPKNYTFITFHQSFSYEDFIEGIKPIMPESDEDQTDGSNIQYEIVPGIFYQACDKAAQLAGYEDLQDCLSDNKRNRQKRFKKDVLEYYLIIDELNRGNVASIFGELITLLEDDKRIGAENEIVLNLPYSKTTFGVPLNLRVIGTMNTADRSVEALDTALRRRFSFQEILPDPLELDEEQEDFPINLRKLLTVINNRIEKLLSRDYTIGHAYLLDVQSIDKLKKVFADKILPLLQEYFYGDLAKVGLVVGESFLTIKDTEVTFMKVRNYDDSDFDERTIYGIKNITNISDEDFAIAVKAIYGE